ncbi:MAG TPA: hypothetical protein VEY09_03165 [Pyrinomonadaceae bacterium]|nr:hypothetical protein [Pyrinomonadaceae bacterium]
MNTMRRFCAVLSLTLTLTLPVLAGDIHFPVTPPPPPSDPAMSVEGHTDGDIHIPKDDEAAVSDPVVEAALSLARAVLALF